MTERANFSKRLRRMLGFSLHSWENLMVGWLMVAGIVAVFIGISTLAVVKLTRQELANSKEEFEAYKLDAGTKIADANARALEAQLALEKLKSPRTLGPDRQQVVADAAAPFAGQRYRAAISQGADDGWESLYATLRRSGWVYLPASMGMGNPTAGIPIAAIPGIEIRLDPAKREKLEAAALALGNALHASKMVVAVNVERQSNPNEAERDILTIVIGARVPPP
jgi:hypothetical protein